MCHLVRCEHLLNARALEHFGDSAPYDVRRRCNRWRSAHGERPVPWTSSQYGGRCWEVEWDEMRHGPEELRSESWKAQPVDVFRPMSLIEPSCLQWPLFEIFHVLFWNSLGSIHTPRRPRLLKELGRCGWEPWEFRSFAEPRANLQTLAAYCI